MNNRDKNFTRGKVERRRAQLEESVARYLSQLDTADRHEPTEALATKTERLKEKLAKLKEEMAKLASIEALMLAAPDQQVSLTDPDSRSMATSGRGSGVVGYNVQVAVDTEHHLIVAHEVTNSGSDRSQLASMAKQAKAILQTEELAAVADRGYFNGPEILECVEAGITVTLPKPMTSGAKSQGRFGKQDFAYVAEKDVYRRAFDLWVLRRRARQEDTPLLDDGVSEVPSAIAMHDRAGAAHPPLGTRARAGRRSGASRCEPGSHAYAPRDGRASVRYHEGADGCDALPDEDLAEGRDRDGALCARLQSDAGDEHRWRQTADRSDRGIADSVASSAAECTAQMVHSGSTPPVAPV